MTSFLIFSMSSVGMGLGRRELHEEGLELPLAGHVLEHRLVDDEVAQGRELDLRAPQRARRGAGDHVAGDRVVGAVARALEAVLVAPPVRRADDPHALLVEPLRGDALVVAGRGAGVELLGRLVDHVREEEARAGRGGGREEGRERAPAEPEEVSAGHAVGGLGRGLRGGGGSGGFRIGARVVGGFAHFIFRGSSLYLLAVTYITRGFPNSRRASAAENNQLVIKLSNFSVGGVFQRGESASSARSRTQRSKPGCGSS